jgi:hypothetical protein
MPGSVDCYLFASLCEELLAWLARAVSRVHIFFHQGRLCMFPTAYGPYGPFVAPEWAVFVPLQNYGQRK